MDLSTWGFDLLSGQALNCFLWAHCSPLLWDSTFPCSLLLLAFFLPPWINWHFFPENDTFPVTCSTSYCHCLMKLEEGCGIEIVSEQIPCPWKTFSWLCFFPLLFKVLSFEVLILHQHRLITSLSPSSSPGYFPIFLKACFKAFPAHESFPSLSSCCLLAGDSSKIAVSQSQPLTSIILESQPQLGPCLLCISVFFTPVK